MKYEITDAELWEMVRFGQKHPDAEFYTEPMSDSDGVFLSCNFYGDEKDVSISYIWELDGVKGDLDE